MITKGDQSIIRLHCAQKLRNFCLMSSEKGKIRENPMLDQLTVKQETYICAYIYELNYARSNETWEKYELESIELITRKVPRLDSVQVDIDQNRKAVEVVDAGASSASSCLLAEVVEHELIVSRVESEAGSQLGLHHAEIIHVHGHASLES